MNLTALENSAHCICLVAWTVVSHVIEKTSTARVPQQTCDKYSLAKSSRAPPYTKGRGSAVGIMEEEYCIEVIHVSISKDKRSFLCLCSQRPITFSHSSEQLPYQSLTLTEDGCSLASITLRRYLGWVSE